MDDYKRNVSTSFVLLILVLSNRKVYAFLITNLLIKNKRGCESMLTNIKKFEYTTQGVNKQSVEIMLQSIADQTQSIRKSLIMKVDFEISQCFQLHHKKVNHTRKSIVILEGKVI